MPSSCNFNRKQTDSHCIVAKVGMSESDSERGEIESQSVFFSKGGETLSFTNDNIVTKPHGYSNNYICFLWNEIILWRSSFGDHKDEQAGQDCLCQIVNKGRRCE